MSGPDRRSLGVLDLATGVLVCSVVLAAGGCGGGSDSDLRNLETALQSPTARPTSTIRPTTTPLPGSPTGLPTGLPTGSPTTVPSTPTRPRDTPTIPAQPRCGNGAIEGDEECDDGNTVGGDGCAVNCTTETRRTCFFAPQSDGTVERQNSSQSSLVVTGRETLTTGHARASQGTGQIPVVIKAEDVQFAPVPAPGFACVCIRAVPLDEFGPGNAGEGTIACGAQGLDDVDYDTTLDHNISDRDPGCTTGFLEDGSPLHPHAGTCNGLPVQVFSGHGEPGATMVRTNARVNLIFDNSGDCQSVGVGDPTRPEGADGMPCTDDDPGINAPSVVVSTTGTVGALLLHAGTFAGSVIQSQVVTGHPLDCSLFDSNDPNRALTQLALVSAAPTIDNDDLYDPRNGTFYLDVMTTTNVVCLGDAPTATPTPSPTITVTPSLTPTLPAAVLVAEQAATIITRAMLTVSALPQQLISIPAELDRARRLGMGAVRARAVRASDEAASCPVTSSCTGGSVSGTLVPNTCFNKGSICAACAEDSTSTMFLQEYATCDDFETVTTGGQSLEVPGVGLCGTSAPLPNQATLHFCQLHASSTFEQNTVQNLATSIVATPPAAPFGCAFTESTATLDGTVAITGSFVDLPQTLGFAQTSVGVQVNEFGIESCTPVAYTLTVQGPLTLQPPDTGRILLNAHPLRLTWMDQFTTVQLTIDGTVDVDCLGAVSVKTIVPVTAFKGDCPDDGVLEVGVGGRTSRVRFDFGPEIDGHDETELFECSDPILVTPCAAQ